MSLFELDVPIASLLGLTNSGMFTKHPMQKKQTKKTNKQNKNNNNKLQNATPV